MKNRINISIELKQDAEGIPNILCYKLTSKLKDSAYFLPMIIDLPTLMEKIFSAMEAGGRYLAEQGYVPKEQMRRILDESFDSAIKRVEPIRELVK